jgi:hypothetical protein
MASGPGLLVVFAVFEPLRLHLGNSGNVREKVPLLAGFLVASVIPQFIALAFLTFVQPLILKGLFLPVEIAGGVVYLLLLVAQFVVAYRTSRRFVRRQAAAFYLTTTAAGGSDTDDTEDEHEPRARDIPTEIPPRTQREDSLDANIPAKYAGAIARRSKKSPDEMKEHLLSEL